jgi:hypothetical protein
MKNNNEIIIIDGGPALRGFFSYVNQVLSNLYIIDKTNKKGIVDIHTSPYHDKNLGSNAWLYYFHQIKNVTKEEFNNCTNITRQIWIEGNLRNHAKLNIETINKFNYIIKKYIKIKQHILDKIQNFKINTIKTDNYASLHYRGTDHSQDCPILTKDYYYNTLDKIIDKYDKILICSDEQPFIDNLKSYYNTDKIINYPCSIISSNNQPIHLSVIKEHNISPYYIGEDVLIESILMAESKFLIRTVSNVTNFSIYYNPKLIYQNLDEHLYEKYYPI